MPLPHFIIAGERRSGTTSLIKYLEAHPDLWLHPRTDMGYFLDDALKGRQNKLNGRVEAASWWHNHSADAYSALFDGASPGKLIGEKSADYIFWEHAAPRMKTVLRPDTKFIITLRNPADRAWSQYWNEVGKGRETLTFEEALRKENERSARCDYQLNHLAYLERGDYERSLRHFFEYFDPEQTLIVTLDEVIADTRAVLHDVYTFLGVDTSKGYNKADDHFNKNWTTFPMPFVQRNAALARLEAGGVKLLRRILKKTITDLEKRKQVQLKVERIFRSTKQQQPFPPELRSDILARMQPKVEALERLIGKDLTAWKPSYDRD